MVRHTTLFSETFRPSGRRLQYERCCIQQSLAAAFLAAYFVLVRMYCLCLTYRVFTCILFRELYCHAGVRLHLTALLLASAA